MVERAWTGRRSHPHRRVQRSPSFYRGCERAAPGTNRPSLRETFVPTSSTFFVTFVCAFGTFVLSAVWRYAVPNSHECGSDAVAARYAVHGDRGVIAFGLRAGAGPRLRRNTCTAHPYNSGSRQWDSM